MQSALTVASSMLRRRPSMCRLYLLDSARQLAGGGTAGGQHALLQSRADIVFEVVNYDEIREVGQEVFNFQTVAFFHDFDCRFDSFAVLDCKHGDLEPQSFPQHIICAFKCVGQKSRKFVQHKPSATRLGAVGRLLWVHLLPSSGFAA
jgi:hypothetical protein